MADLQDPSVARALIYAQRLLQDALWAHDNPGRHYIAQRHVDRSYALTAGLGWGYPGYSHHLRAWGVDNEMQQAIGLLDPQLEEVMVDRVTFPWLSMGGTRVTGIGGRSVRPAGVGRLRGKYANSPDSPWFSKGTAIYGLAQAAKAIHGSWALVVEGPFDMLAGWQLGWTNCVATVGAKVTLSQLSTLARLTDSIVVLLDADEGGRRGQEALSVAYERHWFPAGLDLRTARLAGGKDMAAMLEEQGPDAARAAVNEAVQLSLPLHK